MELRRYILVALFYNCYRNVQGVNKTLAATLSGQSVYSPGYEFGLNYAPNTTYDYRFTTTFPNHTISLTVAGCEMESDKNGDCLYDTLRVYDGYNSSAALLAEFCCFGTARPTWISSTSELYMIFTSDATNEFLGFNITLVSYGPTTTTSTTSTTTTATTTTTTRTTTTTTPTPTTTITTTTVAGTTATAPPTSNSTSDESGGNSNLYIIIGCVIGGLLLIILVIVAICYFVKKSSKRAATPGSDHKRILWSRQTTVVKPFESPAEPPGTVTQTNIFDMTLPDGRANLLPPLSSQMESSLPVISTKAPVIVPGELKQGLE